MSVTYAWTIFFPMTLSCGVSPAVGEVCTRTAFRHGRQRVLLADGVLPVLAYFAERLGKAKAPSSLGNPRHHVHVHMSDGLTLTKSAPFAKRTISPRIVLYGVRMAVDGLCTGIAFRSGRCTLAIVRRALPVHSVEGRGHPTVGVIFRLLKD